MPSERKTRMYLHLGGSTTVPFKYIVGVFDLDTSTISKHTRAYLERAQREGIIINVSEELPRSFIVCKFGEKDETKVYLSQISAQTLLKRAETGLVISDREQY